VVSNRVKAFVFRPRVGRKTRRNNEMASRVGETGKSVSPGVQKDGADSDLLSLPLTGEKVIAFETKNQPFYGWFLCVSGRRDLNPRPSPWQVEYTSCRRRRSFFQITTVSPPQFR
jgi:hypothetical protein